MMPSCGNCKFFLPNDMPFGECMFPIPKLLKLALPACTSLETHSINIAFGSDCRVFEPKVLSTKRGKVLQTKRTDGLRPRKRKKITDK